MHKFNPSYSLLDSGNGRKLEQFGPFVLDRPCSQAVWKPTLQDVDWKLANAAFTRETDNRWIKQPNLLDEWTIEIASLKFKISPTDFGHLGIFPEQNPFWQWIQDVLPAHTAKREVHVLNLFAYSGGSTLASAKGGAHVCHLDASKGMVAWARENAALNQLQNAPIRWIVEDVTKFLTRELRRGKKYDGIILDPPTFGRGSKGEVFKIEDQINELLQQCCDLLSPNPLFLLFSCHTPGFSPLVMQHLLDQKMKGHPGIIDCGEMTLIGDASVYPLPSGTFARWQNV